MTRLLLSLVRLFPASFRRDHGVEMAQFVRAARADGELSGPRLALDLLVALGREWIDEIRPRAPRADSSRHRGAAHLLSDLRRDVRHAARLLSRSPGFTVAAVLTLALGIGGNTAMLALADRTVLRPLAVEAPERLVAWSWTSAYPDYQAYAGRRDVFDGVLAVSSGRVSIDVERVSELASAALVSGNAFDVLGVGAAVGRTLLPSDEIVNGPIVAVLSHDYWSTRFGRDPAVVGRLIRVNNQPVAVVGIARAGFRGVSLAATPAIFLPLSAVTQIRSGPFGRPAVLETRNMVWLNVIGRLRPAVSAAQAAAEMDAQYRKWDPPTPGEDYERLRLTPLTTRALGIDSAGSVQRFVILLVGTVALTLLIGCANLANLLLARGAARRQEVGIQLALGASRGQVARQAIVESLLLAALGGAGGLIVALTAARLLSAYQLPGGIEIGALDLTLNAATVAATVALTLITGLLFGVGPAWRSTRTDVLQSLQRSGTRVSDGSRVRATLVAAQVALCLVLLACSGLFLRSLLRGLDFPLGFDATGVVTASINPGLARYDAARAQVFQDDAVARVRALPAVSAAAWAALIPSNGEMVNVVDVDGGAASTKATQFHVSLVGPDYFRAAGTRLLRGREFTARDRNNAAPVAIVSQAAARTYWAGRDPIGGRIKPGGGKQWHTIVGVVDDVYVEQLNETPVPFVYYPFGQREVGLIGPTDAAHLFVRSTGSVDVMQALVAQTLRSIDARMPLYDVVPFSEHLREILMPQRLGLLLLTFFSLLALSLATIGIYGVASYVTALRAGEMSIRVALGASASDIRRLVLARGVLPAMGGVGFGLLLALWATRLLRTFLYDVDPHDPLTFAAVSVGLLALAVLATWLPARRAGRVNPMAALRQL